MQIPIDTILKEWKSYVTTISRNLMELSEQTDLKIIELKAKDTINGYTGLTKINAMKAVESLHTLWRYYALLCRVVDKASDLNSKDSFLHNTDDEVRQLLENTPITLETERVDISNRTLLGAQNNDKMVTLQELLKFMQESFETTRNTFNEISRATETMQTRLESIKIEISNLYNTALQLGLTDMPLFDGYRVENIESDPLQGLLELDTLFYDVEKYKVKVISLQQDYNKTVDTLHRVEGMLYEIEDLAKKSENAVTQSQKIFGILFSVKPVISEDVLKSLQDWLHVLQNKLSQGGLNAAKIGASKLEQECTFKLEQERENYNNNSKDYNEWLDLKGEFKALLAKLNGLKMRGLSFDNSVDVIVENIQTSLYSDTVNLNSCRELIKGFYSSLKNVVGS